MAKKPKIGNVILAEYTTRGEGGKAILLNVYSGDILVARFPSMIPLSLYIEFFPETREPTKARLEISKGATNIATIDMDVPATKFGDPAILALGQFPMNFDNSANIEVRFGAENHSTIVVLRKNVRLIGATDPASTASSHLFEQSPTAAEP